ncbi:GRAM domain-containing protein [Natrinema sp. 1APR25-10V2]|uniref:GRAM domain-containing protein n=1 Tax=Natrinema sp. 1APR25-10V2 TaxID=2951081 RepID=UPI002876ABE3|nr:GRAM domain-containing protein [Natrinema sp. 1APR25-10V2]MDS0476187.1 GRAM domain-containing protein [Natrinema sp. 1APR25-10V2]
MGDIGSWWVTSQEFRSGEELIGAFYANYMRSGARPLGGKLYLTDQRLLFSPHLLDSALGGEPMWIDLEDIERVTDAEPRAEPAESEHDDSPAKLHVELTDSTRESFVVSDLDDAIEEIAMLVA